MHYPMTIDLFTSLAENRSTVLLARDIKELISLSEVALSTAGDPQLRQFVKNSVSVFMTSKSTEKLARNAFELERRTPNSSIEEIDRSEALTRFYLFNQDFAKAASFLSALNKPQI